MLNFFRRGVTSKIMLGVLGLGLFAIVITGFGTGGSGGLSGLGSLSAETIARAGDEELTATEARETVLRQLAQAQQQQPGLEMGAFLQQGAFEEIVNQLISRKAVAAFAREVGIGVSIRMVDGEIASIPAFRNLAGQFDANTFRQAIAREGISEQALRADISAGILQRQLLLPAAAATKIPEAMAVRYASLLLEERTGTVGLVPLERVGPGKEPSAAEVQAYWKSNVARYTIPERRVLRYAEFGRDNLGSAVTPSDAEIKAYYDQNQTLYGPKQTRTLSQVVLPTEAAARSFVQKAAGGANFAAAAQAAGFSARDTAIGDQSKDAFAKLASAAIADAAFAAPVGGLTAPARSQFGWHVVKVEKVNTVPGKPLADARGEIEVQLAGRKIEEAMSALVTRIEDRIGNGATLAEVAEAEKLTLRETPPLTAGGVQFDDPNFRAPEIQPLMKPAFDMTVDDDPVVETLVPQQRFAVFSVARIVPAAPPPFAQVAQRVKADLVRQRASDRAKAVATALVAKINGGVSARDAFAQAGVALPPPEPVKAKRLEIARPNQPVSPPLAMMFSMPAGRAKLMPAPEGRGWFVVTLERATPGDIKTAPQLVAATRQQFQQIMGEEYARQFTRAMEAQLEVRRNADAMQRTKRGLTTNTAAQ